MLNLAGRTCLVKSVMAAIPTYMMQVFWLPRSIIMELNKTMRRFLWSKQKNNRGWHLINWDIVTEEKAYGGLGVKDMDHANAALLGKAVWNLIDKPGKLWVRVMREKYLSNSSLMQVQQVQNASPVWKGILKARDRLKEGFNFRMGTGTTSLWYADWSGMGKIANQIPYVNIADTQLTLGDLVHNGNWVLDQVYTPLPPQVLARLQGITPQVVQNRVDSWVWEPGRTGKYTVKEAYAWLNASQRDRSGSRNYSWVWKLGVPEKIRLFVWKIIHEALPTNRHRFRCHIAANAACGSCSSHSEDVIHCLRECPHAREVWLRIGAPSWSGFWCVDAGPWVEVMARGTHGLLFLSCLWGIWKWRNKRIF